MDHREMMKMVKAYAMKDKGLGEITEKGIPTGNSIRIVDLQH